MKNSILTEQKIIELFRLCDDRAKRLISWTIQSQVEEMKIVGFHSHTRGAGKVGSSNT